ncbi:MAG: substrate-binding domain-containing protein, partial [Planctomycetaceae bacterium]|nr:substrate-binding domain-containing protein [Planctomycetaceae bacterium]
MWHRIRNRSARWLPKHFLEKKFQHFAYVGDAQEHEWSIRRGNAFQTNLSSRGYHCAIYPLLTEAEKEDWVLESRRLVRWLRRLPKPVGLLAALDVRARQVLRVCFDAGIAVPNEIAVLGVDNDELLCESTYPPLSSILLEKEKSGELAAKLLDQLMHKKVPSGTIYTTGADYLVPRYSTDALQVTDKIIIEAVEFIRANARRGINASDVV